MTRRAEIYKYVCEYAWKHNGCSPSIREVSRHFNLSYATIYRHIQTLFEEGVLDWVDGKLIVIGASWWHPILDRRSR